MTEFLEGLHAVETDETLGGIAPEPEPPADVPDEPAKEFVTPPRRARNAQKYQDKTRNGLNALIRMTAQDSRTSPDSAALIMHGPALAHAVGDLAANDPKVARAIDFLTEGTESPYLALTTAAVPLVLQLIRNHEPVLEPATSTETRGFAIPFTKRSINLRFRVRLGRIRAATNSPRALFDHVFSNPDIRAKLEKQGVKIAEPGRDD